MQLLDLLHWEHGLPGCSQPLASQASSLHSTRSASASGALKAGIPVGDVLIRGGWANPHNFFKYYARTVQVDYSAPAVFKDFFKIQDGKGVLHYAPADPVPVAAFSGDRRIVTQNHPYLFTGMLKHDPVPLQYRKRLKVVVPKAAPVASRTSNPQQHQVYNL